MAIMGSQGMNKVYEYFCVTCGDGPAEFLEPNIDPATISCIACIKSRWTSVDYKELEMIKQRRMLRDQVSN
jgi:hypothetical protein